MGFLGKVGRKIIKSTLEEDDNEIEGKFVKPLSQKGRTPSKKLSDLQKILERIGPEGMLEAVESGLAKKTGGIQFDMVITREDVKNDPQFVVNAIQIAQAVKQLENPTLAPQAPSGLLKKIQDAMQIAQMAGVKGLPNKEITE